MQNRGGIVLPLPHRLPATTRRRSSITVPVFSRRLCCRRRPVYASCSTLVSVSLRSFDHSHRRLELLLPLRLLDSRRRCRFCGRQLVPAFLSPATQLSSLFPFSFISLQFYGEGNNSRIMLMLFRLGDS